MSYPDIAQQTIGEPLANPWYTVGWTSQNPDYQVIPPNRFSIQGFPSSLSNVTVTANYFDDDGNPISGYLTFYPSSPITVISGSTTTVLPQRFVGRNLWDVPGTYWGTGKMYLRNGNLLVSLLATDNSGMTPSSFTYHVCENFLGGQEYDIHVPAASSSPVDIHSLIVSEVPMSSSTAPITATFTSQTVWTMTYNFPYLPAVITIDNSGNQIFGTVNYETGLIAGTVTVTFGAPTSGTMELR